MVFSCCTTLKTEHKIELNHNIKIEWDIPEVSMKLDVMHRQESNASKEFREHVDALKHQKMIEKKIKNKLLAATGGDPIE